MSKVFKSIAPGSSATIEFVSADGNVTVYVRQNIGAIDLSATDAPAIALAVIESAYPPADYLLDGSPEAFLAVATEYLRKASRAIESMAKEAADREALERRRDDLASALADCALSFDEVDKSTQNAINYIIDLEDGATK